MATIVARCPYCRRGGVRAPERIIGSVATCPKCGSQFTIVPQEESEDLTPGPSEDTQPAPALPATDKVKEEVHDGRDAAFTTSLCALVLFGVGVVATYVPFGRFIGLGFCGLGLLLACVSVLGEGLARKVGAAAVGLNLIAVTLLALVPTWLGFDPKFDDENTGLPKGSHSLSLTTNDMTAADRTDSAKAQYANADVRIGVRAFTQPLELTGPNGATRRTRENVLKLHLGITNAGVERRIPLTGWAAGNTEGVELKDPSGAALKVKSLEMGWVPTGFEKSEGVFPGKTAEVILLFEPPVSSKTKRIEYLNLELPGGGVGLEQPIRFKIPGPF